MKLNIIGFLISVAIFFSLHKQKDVVSVGSVKTTQTTVAPIKDLNPDGTPVRHKVKVGEPSEKVYIMGRRFIIFPDDTGVKYELTNIDGKIVPWTGGAADWKDLEIEYVRFTPTTRDITYIVQDWHK
jgi:hypothetical protein